MVQVMSNCKLDFNFYENCLYGKQNWLKLPYGASREKGILDLIHNFVFGHIHVSSLGGSLYYISFIDDLLRNAWFYFLKKIWSFQ